MTLLLQVPVLKIDIMLAVSLIALLLSFFSFVVIYNKAVKNSINKADVENVKAEMKTYIDDKGRALHHRVDDLKTDNEKAHDQMKKDFRETVASIDTKLDKIYEYIIDIKRKN